MTVQLSSEAMQAAVKLHKKSAPDKILRTHVVLQFCLLYRVTLWSTFWSLFVLIMSYIILLTWISSKFRPTPTPYHLAFLYLGADY